MGVVALPQRAAFPAIVENPAALSGDVGFESA